MLDSTIKYTDQALFIISCGKAKVWDRRPNLGPVAARDAYVSSPFKLCRRYAESNADERWIILSAKYGFLHPNDLITQYNKVFGKDADAISIEKLRQQWHHQFSHFRKVVSLCSKAYDARLIAAVPDGVIIESPLKGLNLFQRTAWLA